MKQRSSEMVLSLMLFLMFVVSSFLMIVYGGNIYQNIINNQAIRQDNQIPLTYINNKLNHAIDSKYVTLENIDNIDVLVIDNNDYICCIYYYDNYLYELNISDISLFNATSGNKLYSLQDYSISNDNDIYTITIENNNKENTIVLSLR